MCGRTVLACPDDELKEIFGLDEIPDLTPRFNIAPTEPQAIIRVPGRLELARFGLLPSFARSPGEGTKFINARSETVATRPPFRDAFRSQRCLVIVSGFYEWKAMGKGKQPFYIRREDAKPMAFAGLWSTWVSRDTGEVIESCAIITRTPSQQLAQLHDRMPVILAPDEYAAWIDPRTSDVMPLLAGHAEGLTMFPVSKMVNKAGVNDPRCVERAEPEQGSLL
jgi:putative SOS response-associated peptidase YedK